MTPVREPPVVYRYTPSLFVRLVRNRSGALGLLLVALYLLVAGLAVIGVTPYSSIAQNRRERLQPPSERHWMGTDLFGRDVTSRIMEGAANSLRVAVLSVALAGTAGTFLGAVSGYIGGKVDSAIMGLMDILFAFPGILLALLIVTVLGPGINTTTLAIAIVYTPIFARVARAPVLATKELEFVMAARCLGVAEAGILVRHVLPNTLAPLIVQLSLALSWSLLSEAGLSFLGLGTQPPAASWGVMLSESRSLAEIAPWLMVFPGAAIMLGVFGFNLLGDGLRDVLDPRFRGRV